MGQDSKGGSGPLYKPKNTGSLENQLYNFASNYKPNQSMINDYQGMMGKVRSGNLLSGEKIPTYQPGSNYQYKTPNISYAPEKAYQGVLQKGLDGVQQDLQTMGAQTNRNFAARGLGKSGLAQGAQTTLGRTATQNATNLRRDIGMQQAQDQLGVDKFMADADLRRQGMQGDENFRRAGQSLNAQQAFNQMQQQQIGTMGNLYNQISAEEMKPYQLLSQLYGQNLGVSGGSGGGGKGDPLSAILNAGGMAAGAAFGGPVGAKAGGQMGDSIGHLLA